MRVFVGVEIDDAIRIEAGRVMSILRHPLHSLGPRWVPIENLHITVRFIGQVSDDRVPALLSALDRPVAAARFDMQVAGCGRFPLRGAPRALWIGIGRGMPGLAALHQAFTERVAAFGYQEEARPFSAHLTLARIKDAPAGSGRTVDAALSAIAVAPIVQRVERVTVFESRPSRKGPQYSALRRIELAPSRQER